MNITLISFDFWQYDAHIVAALQKRGINANHINTGAYSHENLQARVKNALSKTILQRNLKYEKRQKYVLESLKKLGKQNQILILNPDTLSYETIAEVRKYTPRLITYLYDSLERFPVGNKLVFFDKIFSFDDQDVQKYGFEKLTNYNYLEHIPQENQHPELDLYYITSFDKHRNSLLKKLTFAVEKLGLKYQFVIVGKKSWTHKIPGFLKKHFVKFKTKRIQHQNLPALYQNTKVLLDLKREGQSGLSFRIFEAMALEKKIITDNEEIQKYDFYNPKNILVLNRDLSNLDKTFFETPYIKLPAEIYRKYTLNEWLNRIFKL